MGFEVLEEEYVVVRMSMDLDGCLEEERGIKGGGIGFVVEVGMRLEG